MIGRVAARSSQTPWAMIWSKLKDSSTKISLVSVPAAPAWAMKYFAHGGRTFTVAAWPGGGADAYGAPFPVARAVARSQSLT